MNLHCSKKNTEGGTHENDAVKSLNVSDLHKGISAMASLFPEEMCPNGAESEPFSSLISLISDKMENLHLPEPYQASVLSFRYSLSRLEMPAKL